MPELTTPFDRMCQTAAQLGIIVLEAVDDQGPWLGDDSAAIVACGECIAINPDIDDDAMRTDVLAMALALTYTLSQGRNGHGRDTTAAGTFVLISRNRVNGPSPGPGDLATLIAREHGSDTASAAFEYAEPVFN